MHFDKYIHTHRERVRRVEEVRLRRLHCVRFLLFKPRLIRQRYTERRRLAPEYMGSNTLTHQRTQLSIVTNVIEREFVATAIPTIPPSYKYCTVHGLDCVSLCSEKCSCSWHVCARGEGKYTALMPVRWQSSSGRDSNLSSIVRVEHDD